MALWLQSGCEQQYGLGVLPCLRACMNAKHSRVCAIIIFHAELMLYTRLLRNNRGMREHFRKLCVLCCTLYPEFPHTHTHTKHTCAHMYVIALAHKGTKMHSAPDICEYVRAVFVVVGQMTNETVSGKPNRNASSSSQNEHCAWNGWILMRFIHRPIQFQCDPSQCGTASPYSAADE